MGAENHKLGLFSYCYLELTCMGSYKHLTTNNLYLLITQLIIDTGSPNFIPHLCGLEPRFSHIQKLRSFHLDRVFF